MGSASYGEDIEASRRVARSSVGPFLRAGWSFFAAALLVGLSACSSGPYCPASGGVVTVDTSGNLYTGVTTSAASATGAIGVGSSVGGVATVGGGTSSEGGLMTVGGGGFGSSTPAVAVRETASVRMVANPGPMAVASGVSVASGSTEMIGSRGSGAVTVDCGE